MASPHNITFIGCGNMGQALLKGFLNSDILAHYTVIKPTPLAGNFSNNIKYLDPNASDQTAYEEALKQTNILIIAVKPQKFEEACADLTKHLNPEALILSIMAGVSTEKIKSVIGQNWPIIRSMPNTPAHIGKSMTGAFATDAVSDAHKKITQDLFMSVGEFLWIENEDLMDAITAVAGSGPAYLFYFIEALTKATEKSGFDQETAALLASQTIIGASALIANDHDAPETLRENVTSPGGTTEAALKVLMDGVLDELVEKAVKAAIQRGKELNA